MKVDVRDPASLRALRPLEVASYLRHRGWQQDSSIDGLASVWLWQPPGAEPADVILPLRVDLADYAIRMGELLQVVSAVEQRSPLDVLRDVSTTSADLIRIRALSPSGDEHTLSLEEGVLFVARSRELLLAAACAAVEPRAYYGKRKAQMAMDYIDRVRMGQTEPGSYVLTILSPVPPELRSQLPLIEGLQDEPFERRVTSKLITALEALGHAATEAGLASNLAPFQKAVASGVSANLCDAIAALSTVSPVEGVDVQVSWAHSRPGGPGGIAHVRIPPDRLPVIVEAARQLREAAPHEDAEVEGFVTRLDRGPDAQEGDVTIYGRLDDSARRTVTVTLGPEQYALAVEAHGQRMAVKCVGDVVREGRRHRLRSPRHFEVLNPEEGG